MKSEDARAIFLLEHCAERCDGYQKDDACENCEINAAIEALNKQIPFTPETNNLKAENFVGGRGMTELKKCPVCGKQPKVKRDYNYEASGFGAWCTIQCKPLIGRPHLKIEEGKATWDRALEYAIEAWNRRAE